LAALLLTAPFLTRGDDSIDDLAEKTTMTTGLLIDFARGGWLGTREPGGATQPAPERRRMAKGKGGLRIPIVVDWSLQ